MANNKSGSRNPGMMLLVTFLTLLVVNSLVVFSANSLFPQWVVLGTSSLTPFWAVVLSVGVLALIDTFAIPFIRQFENSRGKMFTSKEWMIVYFLVNLVGVWLIARFPNQFGLGIRSWIVAVILAIVLDFLQGIAMMQLGKFRTKFS